MNWFNAAAAIAIATVAISAQADNGHGHDHEGHGEGGSSTSDVNVNVQGDRFSDLPVNTAAALILGNCQKGASGQFSGFGAALASTDEVCHLFSLYALRQQRGEFAQADEILEEITDIMKIRTNPVRRVFQGIPLLGSIF